MTGGQRRCGRIVTLGESMGLIRATEPGSLAQIDRLRLGIGGAEANVTIGLARLGVPTGWLGRVGDDSLGRRIMRELRAEEVVVHGVVDPGAATGLMLKESPTPESTVVHYYRAGSAGSRLDPGDLDVLAIEEAALLHVTGITLALSASARETVRAAIDRAVSAGVPVSFDINHRSRLWTDTSFRDLYRETCARATVVFAGLDEAALVVDDGVGRTPRELAEAIASLGSADVVIKLGADGAVALEDDIWRTQPAVDIDPVDTVGAGDAFVAGWLAEWHGGSTPEQRLATAVRAGACVCMHPGDWEGLPFRRDLERFGKTSDPVSR